MFNKIKNLWEKRQLRRWKKNTIRMKKTLEKIKITSPELTLIPPPNSGLKRLSPAEQIHLFRESQGIRSQIWNHRIMALLTVVIIILTIVQIHTAILINESNKIYMQSIRPDLHIRPYSSPDNQIPSIDRDRIGSINLDNSTGLLFNFQITNTGKMDSGPVRITVINNWSSTGGIISGYVNFNTIPSGGTVENGILLTTIDCFNWHIFRGGNISNCTSSKNIVPLGLHPLELKVDCVNCDPQVFYVNITVCFNQYPNTNCSD